MSSAGEGSNILREGAKIAVQQSRNQISEISRKGAKAQSSEN
jgi:hypothetical protein